MKSQLVLLFVLINLLPVCFSCETRNEFSGTISNASNVIGSTCWIIVVPAGFETVLTIEKYTPAYPCVYSELEIIEIGTTNKYNICGRDSKALPINSKNNVQITLKIKIRILTSITLNFQTETPACKIADHFKCTNHTCIPVNKVCDGIKDCENGADEEGCGTSITAIKGINSSREICMKRLISGRSESFGWGVDTHRAVMALSLANESYFNSNDLETNLTLKELQLRTAVAILKNFKDDGAVNDFAMYIGALTATCHNTEQFYGFDLLKTLSEQVASKPGDSPGAYLALCSASKPITKEQITSLIKKLSENSKPESITEFEAVAVMALTCIKNRTKGYDTISAEDDKVYNDTINKMLSKQAIDGSYGDSSITGLTAQALHSATKAINKTWNFRLTMRYLMSQVDNSASTPIFYYYSLPILNGKCYMDIVKCDKFRQSDTELENILITGKIRVQYSLYIGDEKNKIYSNYFNAPEKSSIYDVMKIAAMADPKYKFLNDVEEGNIIVYKIGEINNDPEAGKYWFLYTVASDKETPRPESPDKISLNDKDHFIFWYKTLKIKPEVVPPDKEKPEQEKPEKETPEKADTYW